MRDGTAIVRCDLCLFFEPKTVNGDLGVCRRHAPKPILSPARPVDDKPNVIWPQVTHSDYCGDGVPGETAEFTDE